MLAIEGTKTATGPAVLSRYAEHWGIRKIHRGGKRGGKAFYPCQDVLAYMEDREADALARIRKIHKHWKPPILEPDGKQKRLPTWLHGLQVIYMLGMVGRRATDTADVVAAVERKALRMLATHAQGWRIRKFQHPGQRQYTSAAYAEEDVLWYIKRKEEELRAFAQYLRHYPVYAVRPLQGPPVTKWWGDEEVERALQLGIHAKRTGKPSARFIQIELSAINSVPELRGYVSPTEVANRFGLTSSKVSTSHFFDRFSFHVGDVFRSKKWYDGDLIELYFREKQESGEKVYRMTTPLPTVRGKKIMAKKGNRKRR